MNVLNQKQGDLWKMVVSFENLYRAYQKARKGKQQRDEVAQFSLELELSIFDLQDRLQTLTWQPGAYRHFTIYDRKPRTISAAPFADRVVHHAIMNILEPVLDPLLYGHCYACRKGKGTHRAVDQYQHWARRFTYVLKLDVQQYFHSVNQSILKRQLQQQINDSRLLTVLFRIIDSYKGEKVGCGMPIGNLTSQFFANFYLNEMDHWVYNTLDISAYLRYVDDLVLLADSKAELWHAADEIGGHMTELGLMLHSTKKQVYRTTAKVDMFGYQVSRKRRWLRNDNGYRYRRKLKTMAKLYADNRIRLMEITPRINSWIGHVQHGETLGLRKQMFNEIIFSRA